MSFSDPQTVADLLPAPTLDQVKQFLLAYLGVPENDVDDWVSGAALRTMWETESLLIADLSGNFLAGLLANAYASSASGTSLARVAHGWYAVDGATPTAATQSVVVACDSAHGPYTSAQVTGMFGVASDGSVYQITTSSGLASGGQSTLTMTAASPGAARAVVTGLGNRLAGVSVVSASVLTFGSGGSTDAQVKLLCADRWPDLAALPDQEILVTWALDAVGAAVTRFRLDADPAYPGGVLLTLGSTGTVSGGTVSAVQAALDDLSPVTDVNTAQAAANRAITASGVVVVRDDLLAAAQATADATWAAYLTGAQIGSKVYLQALRKAVGDAIKGDPLSNFTGAALAGAGADGNVVLASDEQPLPAGSLISELTWVGR